MTFRVFLSLVFVLCPTLAQACDYPVRRAVRVVNDYVTPAVIAVAVPVVVPLYGAAYVPPPPQPVVAAPSQNLSLIIKRLDAMQRQLDTALQVVPAEANAKTPAALPAQNHAGLAVLNTKCASCHDASKAQANAKGIVFLEGGKLHGSITDGIVASILLDVYKGHMPKKGEKLTDQELADVVDYFDSLKSQPKDLPPVAAPPAPASTPASPPKR